MNVATDGLLISPTQRRMLTVLLDGKPHPAEELHSCLHDELGALSNIRFHISQLRRALRYRGSDIASQRLGGKTYYLITGPASQPSN